MIPASHLLISWLSTIGRLKNRRERTLVTLAGIAPDLDGLGVIVDKISGATQYYFQYHHFIGHAAISAFALATLVTLLSKTQRLTVWLLTFLIVHLHILCDVIGSKGPDGYHWPIHYLYPFNPEYELSWKYQWELDAWQNWLILALLIAGCIYYAWTKKITVLEVFSKKLNNALLDAIHKNHP